VTVMMKMKRIMEMIIVIDKGCECKKDKKLILLDAIVRAIDNDTKKKKKKKRGSRI